MDENPILMHFDAPFHRGPLENATHVGYARSAACGDEVTMYLVVEEGRVITTGFVASGCMVCQAAASILCEAIECRKTSELDAILPRDMLELIGVPLTLRRQQCGLLAYAALRQAFAVRKTPADRSDQETEGEQLL